jgi:hypothetical protein
MRDTETTPQSSAPYKALWGVFFVLILAGCISRLYFGVLVRDQAELVALSQQYMAIYDEQIPVLSWIMTALFRVTDYFILWPDIYKFICLGLCLVSIFRLTSHITKNAALSLIAALSLFFLPTFHEDMLGEVTHTAALLAATGLSTEWLVRKKPEDFGQNRTLLILISFWLVGFLAKHTMALVIIAQISAYLLVFRPQKSTTSRLIVSAGITFMLILPIYLIIASQLATLGQGLEEFKRDAGFTRGLYDLLTSILSEAAIFILLGLGTLAILLARKTRRPGPVPSQVPAPARQVIQKFQTEASRFLLLTMLFIIAAFIPFIIAADMAVVRDRWLAPALMLLGPLMAIAMSEMRRDRAKKVQNLFISFVCVLGLFRAAEPFIDTLSQASNIDNAPIAQLSENLREAHPDIRTYISSNYNLVATLKLQDPSLRIYTQKTISLLRPRKDSPETFIRISLDRDPALRAPHITLDCAQDRAETLQNWSYSYAVCEAAGNP